MASSLVLVGDIGGTNSRLQAYEISPDDKHTTGCAPGKIIKEQQFLNGDFKAFDDVLRAFLAGIAPPSAACLAVAGPVERNAVSFTNRDWVIDGGALERRFGIGKVRLVNDFVANGYGLLTLDEAKECVTLQAAPKVAGAPMACVGAGTGLGECFSTASAEGSPYETFASEGGHSDWAPRTALEVELLGFLKDRFGQKHRVSVERVISGPGLATMYDFFSARFPDKVVAEVHAAVGAAGELKGKVIAQHSAPGAAPFCELCRLTMETFATAFGAEAASAALKWVPLGGLYIAGGMTPKNLRLLEGADSLFMRAFGDKGRLSPLLKRVPVYAVLAEDIGQRGAHLVAFRMLRASAPSAAPSDIPAVQRFFHRLMLRSLPLSPLLAARSVVLVGDVGGTNTRLQLYAVEEGARVMDQQRAPGKLIHSAQYLNGDFGSFDQIVSTFLADQPSPSLAPPPPPSAACLAVAGPVERNAVSFTNRDWVIDGGALERRFGIGKVRLVNDFVANGYGLLTLDEAKECVTLQAAPKVAGAPMACVGAGTGLGECFSTASAEGSPYETFASEGGHSDWAPRTALEVELLGFLKDRFGQKHRVSVERVISGPGLATMYDFFSARFPDKVVAEVHVAVGAAGELKGKVIAQHSAPGAAPFCELCRLTMETFATAFGAEAASAALKWVPLGGLYIAGGMTPKNLRLLEGADSLFMRAFGDKGRLSPLLKRVPVYAVLAEDIGQRGAHLVAFRMLLTMQEEQEEVLRAPDAKEAQASLPTLAEFNAIKHSLSWRGSYPRKLMISPNEIITKDPSGNITNRWSKHEFTAAAAIEEENEDAARFVIKLLSGGLLCGMGSTDLTFSALDKEQRSVILKTLESLAVA